jgi:hypothetical protein
MVELLVAMTVFLIIGGAAFSLFGQHARLFNDQQNQVGLNISMRNALSQIEADVVNAGTGYYLTVARATWPVGLTISNSAPGGGCYNAATFTYQATCFDTMNILTTDSTTTPAQPDNGAGTGCTDTTTNTLFMTPPAPPAVNPATNAAWTAAAYAGQFKNGDQLLFVGTAGNFNSAVLTAAGVVSGAEVKLTHAATSAAGLANSTATDPLKITTHDDPNLSTSFCQATDWVVKLAPPIVYTVNAVDPTNPQLTRAQGGAAVVVAEQIIGFKVGASTFVAGASTSTAAYNYDSSTYTPKPFDYNSIRSVRVSLIGRTPPNLASPYRNAFDNGPYKIESMSVVVNPRNLSMND